MAVNLPPTVAARIEQFTGRTWLLPEVLDWYERDHERILLVSGGPGTGKSMIMAWLAGHGPEPDDATAREQLGQIRAEVKAAHFCVAASGSTAPKALAQNLAEQLTRNVPGFADALAESLAELVTIKTIQEAETLESGASMTGVQIGTLNLSGLGEELSFNRTLREPLQKLYEYGHDEPVLLLVDALDEALTYTGTIDIVRLLAKLEDLPEQVRFLVTSRPDERVLWLLPGARVFHLDRDVPPDQVPGQDDVCRYVLKRLEALAPGLKAEGRKALAGRISLAAEGIFLYAHLLLADLEKGVRQVADLERAQLPRGLPGLYQEFLNRELGVDRRAWRKTFRPVLGLIAVAQGEGLSATQLERLAGEEVDVEEALEVCRQYLEGELPDGPFRVFHRSLSDFLLQEPKNKAYRVDAAEMHSRIANYYWTEDDPNWQKLRDVEDSGYGLDSLAAHLHLGGQGNRLKALISQEWMAARFKGSNYTYDGFIDDLMLAWRQAYEEGLAQIEAGKVPASMADCTRYALLRASVNSLIANYEPALVARAVETGLWPTEQALSVARRGLLPRYRVDMFAALLATGTLNDEQSTQAQEAGLADVQAITAWEFRARALARLAPNLSGQALERGLKAALAIEEEYDIPWSQFLLTRAPGPWDRVDMFAGLLATGRLGPKERTQTQEAGLAAALAIEKTCRAQALARLAPQLSNSARVRAVELGLETALDLKGYEQVAALAKLAPQLSGRPHAKAVELGMEAALAIKDEGRRAQALVALVPWLGGKALQVALASLAPQLNGKAQDRGLAVALAINDEWARAEALAWLAPQLNGEALERGLRAALAMGDERWRAEALAALAPQLSGKALEQGLATARAIKNEWWRAEALAGLAPRLSGEVLKRGLRAALVIEDKGAQAQVLAVLSSQLNGETSDEIVERGLEAALAIDDEHYRVEALTTLVSRLSREALGRGLRAALDIEPELDRAWALATLALRLSGEDRVHAVDQGLVAAMAVKDELDRARVLAALVPSLSGEARARAVAQGLVAAMAVRDQSALGRALATALVPQLSRKALERSLAAGLADAYEQRRVQALAALAPHLTGEAREQALAYGLEAARAVECEGYRAEALAALAPWLTGKGLEQALEEALALGDSWSRAYALATLGPKLTGRAQSQAVEAGLTAALAIRDKQSRAYALAALIPQLTGEARSRALVPGLEAALDIEDGRRRALALAAFLPVAPDRVALLRSARQAMADHMLNNFPMAKRYDVLRFCAEEKLFAPPVLDQDTLAAIAGQIVEVCQEWRWM